MHIVNNTPGLTVTAAIFLQVSPEDLSKCEDLNKKITFRCTFCCLSICVYTQKHKHSPFSCRILQDESLFPMNYFYIY